MLSSLIVTTLWGKHAEQGSLSYLTGWKFALMPSGKAGSKRSSVIDLPHAFPSSPFVMKEADLPLLEWHRDDSGPREPGTPHQPTWKSLACPRPPLKIAGELDNIQACVIHKWLPCEMAAPCHWRWWSRTLITTYLENYKGDSFTGWETFLNSSCLENSKRCYCIRLWLLANNLSGINQRTFTISQFLRVQAWLWLGPLLRVSPAIIRVSAEKHSHPEGWLWKNLFQAHSDYWQNSFPCGYMSQDPSFLLAASWKLSSAPKGCSLLLASWASSIWSLISPKLSRRVSLSAGMDSYITKCNHGKLHPNTFAFFCWLEASYRFTCTQGEVLHRDASTRRQGSLEVTLEPVLHKYLRRKFKVLSNLPFQYPRINTTPSHLLQPH